MKSYFTLTVLLIALISIYVASAWNLPRHLLGAQLNPLPALMLVVALRSPISTIGMLSIFGSFAQSALSSNPLGLSLIPLYLFGFIVHMYSHSLSHHHSGSRLALGAAAGALIPIMSLGLLLLTNKEPLFGWFTLWQWAIGTLSSGLIALMFFPLIEWLDKSVEEQPLAAPYDTSTRIVRGTHFNA